MSTGTWGPPTWRFLHTLAWKIREDRFAAIFPQLFVFIARICTYLPCPECSRHATGFLRTVYVPGVKKRADLINILHVFHNKVNARLSKPEFAHGGLDQYQSVSVIGAYNEFVRHFNTNGNMNLITESFHRRRLLAELRVWVIGNINAFVIE
jgi:hypothetical protein